MMRRGAAILCLAFFLLPLLPPVPPVSTAAGREGDATHRIYSLVRGDQAQQRLRAGDAYRLWRGNAGVEWVGVQRGSSARETSFPSVSASEVLGRDDLPPVVAASLRRAVVEDEVLVENRLEGRVASGPGRDLHRIARAAGLLSGSSAHSPVSTDVGFTTWGKVKELFR